ncbi:MAG TPA: phage tail tube protein, partial [Buttiauxella sp.]
TLIFYKIVYPNGAIDLFRGWISGLGKTVAAKDIMTRTVKITNSGRPPALAEELADPEPAPEVEKLRASVKSTSTKSE